MEKITQILRTVGVFACVGLLAYVALGVADAKSRRVRDEQDAARLSTLFRDYYALRTEFQNGRRSWILDNRPDGIVRGTKPHSLACLEYELTPNGKKQVERVKEIQAEWRDQVWRHIEWQTLWNNTPSLDGLRTEAE